MSRPQEYLDTLLQAAMISLFPALSSALTPDVRPATNKAFGHFQSNLPLRLAKPLGMSPKDIGAELLPSLTSDPNITSASLQGPGFLNITLSPHYITDLLQQMSTEPLISSGLGSGKTVVVDYASPNVAKTMHVGHLRSTVIGDALVRVLTATGHKVIRQNHVGDWGTQFGMLIEYILQQKVSLDSLTLAKMSDLYKASRVLFDADPEFAVTAGKRVVALQSKDPQTLAIWENLVSVSQEAFTKTYNRLQVSLTPSDFKGESFYNSRLQPLVDDLKEQGTLVRSEGALCAFLPGFTNRKGEPLPLLLQKKDGGFIYATTDIAALDYRIQTLKATRVIYVVDARQGLHFQQVFAFADHLGWLTSTQVDHVAFGTVLGPDGKPFKTRSGSSVSLTHLLNQATAHAAAMTDPSKFTTKAQYRSTAQAIGLAALKYADLSSELGKDYTFDPTRMVSTTGNTGPYLQYMHTRLCSILKKAGTVPPITTEGLPLLSHPAEHNLTLALAAFSDVVEEVATALQPHKLCNYLYELASTFATFYESCPVLTADPTSKISRLALCSLTASILYTGLDLLGIQALEKM